MLWQRYVFRRGADAIDTWDRMFEGRPIRLLYIAGRGFDLRAQTVMLEFVQALQAANHRIDSAELLLVSFSGYELGNELREQTEGNARALERLFEPLGPSTTIPIGPSAGGEDDVSATNSLRLGTEAVLKKLTDQTDVVLDVSSLPRVAYLALMTGLLHKLIPNKAATNALWAGGVNLQILVAEDAALDGQIRSEDPSNELILIPGFSSALHAESMQHWPLVWFPILGENRSGQLQKVMSEIPDSAEICPVLPSPSRDPRRADRLVVEYKRALFDTREGLTTNILYAHEANPFEAYRQLYGAMNRYRISMDVMGGCRLVLTPLGSKLITLGAGLACFDMRPEGLKNNYGVAIPYAEPTRYLASPEAFKASKPEVSMLLLTGDAYQ